MEEQYAERILVPQSDSDSPVALLPTVKQVLPV